MDFLELAKDRYSCRKYSEKRISSELIDQILEAARVAPTAHNYQPQEILVVSSEEGLAKIDKCTVCHYHAPLAFIVGYNKSLTWTREYDGKSSGDVDASIVATHMMLEAKSIGIDSVWLMHFIPEAVITEFELPDEVVPVAILLMGYAEDEASPSHFDRRSIEAYVSYR